VSVIVANHEGDLDKSIFMDPDADVLTEAIEESVEDDRELV
jgi:hypothetical protein